jgi:hypothetical protein
VMPFVDALLVAMEQQGVQIEGVGERDVSGEP